MIIGHQRILDFLKKSLAHQRLAHAYLFSGPRHLGKKKVALEFIKMLIGRPVGQSIQPDILIIQPDEQLTIGLGQVKKAQHHLKLSAYQSSYKIVLIDQAERMTHQASNSLLKTLEEPVGQTVIILISSDWQNLLPTIISRCQLINFLPVSESEMKKNIQETKIVRLANGRPGLAIQYLEKPELLKEEDEIINQLEKMLRADLNERYQYAEEISKDSQTARKILSSWLLWFRDLILMDLNCSQLTVYQPGSEYRSAYSLNKLKNIIQTIKKTDSILANPGLNARLALEVLMLEI